MRNKNDRLSTQTMQGPLAGILESVDAGVISKTPDGIITAWNREAECLFGYPPEEIIGRNAAILCPAEPPELEIRILEQFQREPLIQHYETKRVRKDGRLIAVRVTLAPVPDEIGRLIAIMEICRDLSQRERLERAEFDQLFLAAIVASADDAIISKDVNGIVTSWNQGAEKLFDYSAEEMTGQPIGLLIPSDRSDEGLQILERIRRGERIVHYETQRVRKDGQVIDVSLTVSPIKDRMGRSVGASTIVRDISERRRWQKAEVAESFLGALVESAEDAIVSKTLDGIVTSWNRAAENLYGYAADEIIGKPIALLVPSDHPDEEPQILERICRGERIEHYETKRVRKDGQLIDVALTVSPIKDSLGRIIGASKIARDITEQKRAKSREQRALQEAQEARQQAEEASRAKDAFLATVSHELRTPMTAILGWTCMLMNSEVNPETQKRAIEIIERNARSQAQLIEDLLDISRIVSGKLRVDFKPVDLAAVIAAAVEAVRPAAQAKRIRIHTTLSSSAGPVRGDFERLQQVVWNLLSNAIRFTPSEGLVQIELQRVESQIELRVSDNGIGIKPEFLPYIFDRFTQADSSIKRSYGGLGMGLAIVKSLMELHGGVVFVSSSGEGNGAIFTLKLPISPLRREPEQAPPPERRSSQAAFRNRNELTGVNILVVDDERDTCDLLRYVFNECGAVVETANSAEEALRLFDKSKPDILVSDIGMPQIDGYELIRIIRNERHSRIPAVALTALARIDDRIKALTAGYQMHVAKPVEPVELITIVMSLVGLVNPLPPGESSTR